MANEIKRLLKPVSTIAHDSHQKNCAFLMLAVAHLAAVDLPHAQEECLQHHEQVNDAKSPTNEAGGTTQRLEG